MLGVLDMGQFRQFRLGIRGKPGAAGLALIFVLWHFVPEFVPNCGVGLGLINRLPQLVAVLLIVLNLILFLRILIVTVSIFFGVYILLQTRIQFLVLGIIPQIVIIVDRLVFVVHLFHDLVFHFGDLVLAFPHPVAEQGLLRLFALLVLHIGVVDLRRAFLDDEPLEVVGQVLDERVDLCRLPLPDVSDDFRSFGRHLLVVAHVVENEFAHQMRNNFVQFIEVVDSERGQHFF